MNKKIVNYFFNNIPFPIGMLFFIMLVGALFEVVGIGLFIPLLTQDSTNNFIGIIKNFFDLFNIQYSNFNIALLIIVIFVIKFIVVNIQNFYIYKTSYDFMYSIKTKIMNKIYTMDFIEFNKIGVDQLNNIFTKEIEKSSLSIRYFLQIGVNGIYSMVYLVFALYINYLIVFIAIFVGAIVVFIQKKVTKAIIKYSKVLVEGNAQTNLIVLQILTSIKYIISTNRQAYNNKIFDDVSYRYSKNYEKMSFLNSIPKHTPEFVGVLIISLIIIINETSIKENIVTVVFLGLLLYRIIIKLLSIQKSYQDFLINIGAIDKIINIEKQILKNQTNITSDSSTDSIKNINFKSLDLKIDSKIILENINFQLKQGNIYAIVGESGAGKSSLLNILTCLYSFNNGTLTINNLDITNIDKKAYRDKIGYVSQESVIFEGSIKENIIFGREFDENLYNEIVQNLNIKNIKVENLCMGGTNISGGQKQLIALARELYKKTDLLILDEFTSALDSVTEKLVMNYINKIKNDKTIIIVAHRLSSIIGSDKVVLMNSGKIVEQLDFKTLYLTNNEFKLMCNNQNIYLDRIDD